MTYKFSGRGVYLSAQTGVPNPITARKGDTAMEDMNSVFINPKIVTWALRRGQLSPDEIASDSMPAEAIRGCGSGANP
jgi:hypothetical protein